ncbi:sigma-70 family RNA polymerase sigma factor [Candidatus Poribacteria bacterium]|nr:sigma-70 family RNA polymerase sigma factor [Candidatus Poribacteria bacterium]
MINTGIILNSSGNLEMEDAELIRLCQEGDMSAFESIFRKHQNRVYNVTYRMMGNQDDAMDMTQDIFVKAYQKIGKFNFKSSFSTWIYRIAVNHCIDELRKRKRNGQSVPLEEAITKADETTPEKQAVLNDRQQNVWKAINSLKDKDRSIIILRDIEGLSYKEISKVMKCSMGRVKSRIHEARQKLKKILEEQTELWNEI